VEESHQVCYLHRKAHTVFAVAEWSKRHAKEIFLHSMFNQKWFPLNVQRLKKKNFLWDRKKFSPWAIPIIQSGCTLLFLSNAYFSKQHSSCLLMSQISHNVAYQNCVTLKVFIADAPTCMSQISFIKRTVLLGYYAAGGNSLPMFQYNLSVPSSGPLKMGLIYLVAEDSFGGLVVRMLASGSRVRRFKPGRSRWIFSV
jgi:hypothetical protein